MVVVVRFLLTGHISSAAFADITQRKLLPASQVASFYFSRMVS